jgi:hypothetical protein
MDIASQVAEILSEAERKLAALTADALERRDYAAVQTLSAIAERIAGGKGARLHEGGASRWEAVTAVDLAEQETIDHRTSSRFPATPSKSNAPTNPFPHFYRDGEQLIKIGYSKSERRTYEHRSPRAVLERLAGLLVNIASEGQLFTTERILKELELESPALPTYQIYLCLGFLVRSGLVQKNGRLGYTLVVPLGGEFADAVRAAWETLAAR